MRPMGEVYSPIRVAARVKRMEGERRRDHGAHAEAILFFKNSGEDIERSPS